MPDSSDLEARVAAPEARLVEVEQQIGTAQIDASAARELAAGADRDVSEVGPSISCRAGQPN